MAREIIDITVPLRSEMGHWPGDPEVSVEAVSRIAEGGGANISKYCFSSHASTHVDPPYHFIESGHKLDQVPLESLIGPCWVVDVGGVEAVTAEALEAAGVPGATERLLIKTANSAIWGQSDDVFHERFAYITPDAADWVLSRGIRLLGIDYLSVAEFRKGGPVHKKLLEANVVVLEGVNLSAVEPGEYTLICLPLLVKDGDGAPARTVLVRGA